MRWVWIGVAIIVGAVAVLAGIGYSMPNAHVAQVQAEYDAPPDSVYRVLSDIENWPDWHPSVQALSPVEADTSGRTWKISGTDGSMIISLTLEEPPRRFVTLADGGMFIGRWTYHLEPRQSGTRVTITEEARIDNLVVRALASFRNQTATIERVLRALGQQLGERVEPRPLT